MSDYIQRHFNQNVLLAKDQIGKSKNIGYQVPSNVTFGKKCYQNGRDSAKDSVNNWTIRTPTKKAQKFQDYIQSNKIQAQQVVKLESIQKVFKDKKIGKNDIKMNFPDHDFIYGKPSWQDQNMKKIINQDYKKESEHQVQQFYDDLENRKKLEDKNRQQLRTKSVAPRMLLNPHSPSEKDAFKMKKFQKVNSKYKNDKINWNDILNLK